MLARALSDNEMLGHLSEADHSRIAEFLEREWYDPARTIVRAGEEDRALYLVLEGEARIVRGHLEVGLVHAGEHFGELALVAVRKRAASIVEVTRIALARLSLQSYEEMIEREPELAIRLTRALIAELGERLTDMTESVDQLLRERSLPRRTSVEVTVSGQHMDVRAGTQLGKLLPATHDGHLVVGGLVDHVAESLINPVSAESTIEPLTTAHWEGQRIYRRSLALLLLNAAEEVDPELQTRMGDSLGFAQRVAFPGATDPDWESTADALEAAMRELIAQAAPLREEWWTVGEARAYFAQRGWEDARELLDTWRDAVVPMVSYGEQYALRTGPLLPSTDLIEDFGVLPDADGCLLIYGEHGTPPASRRRSVATEARITSRHVEDMTRAHHRWLRTLGMSSVGAFNQACLRGEVDQLIRVVEGFHEKRIGQIADEIVARPDRVKVVCIAGPSSSGKTTFIKRLKVQLQVNGIHPFNISLDDYYVDRDKNPRDESGDYDFEAFEALRRNLLSAHLARLLAGETVNTASYSFTTGRSDENGGRVLSLGDKGVLMLEGIHGLNPRLLAGLPEDSIFRIYICPLAQLPFDRLTRVHTSDLRLLRRIVRGRHFRAADAVSNIARWPSVRRGERKNIFPFKLNADAVFDSSLIYEPSVLKVFAEQYLLEVPRDAPEYATAFRLLQLLDRFITIYPDHVPPTSILREYIGGSGFKY